MVLSNTIHLVTNTGSTGHSMNRGLKVYRSGQKENPGRVMTLNSQGQRGDNRGLLPDMLLPGHR